MLPKAKHLKNLFALDFGTTKFCLAMVRDTPAGAHLGVDIVSVPADGMRRGMVANIEQAEKQFGADIARVVVGVAGSHLGSRIVTETRTLAGDVVDSKDLQALIDQVEARHGLDGREILHTVPIGFRVDQRETVDDPVGFRGKSLAGDFFLIDADRFYLRDLVELCNESGLQVVRLYSEPFASASVTVPDSFKQLGVACADIGGGTTDGIVFKGGRPIAAFTVNVAGKLMTNDLAIGLSVPPATAETVKLRFGIKPRDGDAMDVKDIRGQGKTVTGAQVMPILLPRIHELCNMTARSLVPFRGTLGAGLLLTGGGADVKGITDYFQAKLGIPVARARPALGGATLAEDAVDKSAHPPKHATVIGLLNLELCRLGDLQRVRKTSWTNRYLGSLVNWIKELS
jgi:cell division protein FtsA